MRLQLWMGSAVIALCAACPWQDPPQQEQEEGQTLVGIVTEAVFCPVIESLAASPLEVWVNASIELEATIKDGPAAIRWTAESGRFDDPIAAVTQYRCVAPGEYTLTLTIEEGTFCEDSDEVDVACTESPLCGNDELDDTEACDDGNTKSGDGCSSHCTLEVD